MRHLVLFCFAFCALPSWTAALSKAECDEVFEKFQVSPAVCQGLDEGTQSGTWISEEDNTLGLPSISASDEALPVSEEQLENNVFFPGGGAVVSIVARAKIDELAKILQSSVFQDTCIQLIGHSDAVGDETSNLQLGLERARVVARELSRMIDGQRIADIASNGEGALLPNVAASHPYQRRVEVRVRDCVPQF